MGSKLLSENDILIVPMDITKIHTHQECLNRVLAHFGTLDILVNNAGRSQRAIWQDIELEVDRQMFELNVFGPVSLTRLAVKYFLQKGTGHVAVTSSIAGVIPAPYSASYTGTKHAINVRSKFSIDRKMMQIFKFLVSASRGVEKYISFDKELREA